MLSLRRVLFPTDFSPCADRAFGHAAFLAERHGAELHVLHVRPVTGLGSDRPHEYPAPTGLQVAHVTVQSTSVSDTITDHARDADLVVMGTHGRRGVRRASAGSTTEDVLRRADCPVLAVGLEAERSEPAAVERILAPVDFSASSGPALALAGAMAGLYGARVDVFHAPYLPALPEVYGIGLRFEGAYPGAVASSTEALRALADRALAPEHRGEVVVRVGPPGPTILAEAERLGTGLLVMPTHGRTGMERIAFGSVAEHVLRRARCAVLGLKAGRTPLAGRAPTARPGREIAAALADHDV